MTVPSQTPLSAAYASPSVLQCCQIALRKMGAVQDRRGARRLVAGGRHRLIKKGRIQTTPKEIFLVNVTKLLMTHLGNGLNKVKTEV